MIQRRESGERKVGGHTESQVSETMITSLESGGKICPSCTFTNSYLARNLCEKCGMALQQTARENVEQSNKDMISELYRLKTVADLIVKYGIAEDRRNNRGLSYVQ